MVTIIGPPRSAEAPPRQRIVLVHGIRTNGVQSIYRIGSWLDRAGYDVIRADLPIRRALQVRWVVKRDSEALAAQIEPGDVLVGHSYGGALTIRAAMLAPIRAAFIFNAALEDDTDLSSLVGDPPVWNIYSQGDRTVWLSGLIPWHPFGRAGFSGLKDLPDGHNVEIGGGHSDAWVGQNAERWADWIHEKLVESERTKND